MKMKPTRMLLLLCGTGLAACDRSDAPSSNGVSAGRPVVFTVNYPLAYFAQRIGGAEVKVVFPGPAGEDPAYWNPDPETIVRFQTADLILLNGAGYAGWTKRVSLPLAKLVDCGASQKERFLVEESGLPHTHGPGGEHSHGDVAFTLWLDPRRAVLQVETIRRAFDKRWPDGSETEAGYRALLADLEQLDRDLERAFGKLGKRPILFSHPVYHYLQDRYGLNGRSLHWEPGSDPGDKEWLDLERLLEEHPASLMIWEDKPLDGVAARLREKGIRSIVYRPCANRPAQGDFLSIMRENLEAVRAVEE